MSIKTLLLMAFLHFIAMYFLMYAMVDNIGSVIPNLNNLYMAGMMTAPMIIIEGFLMKSMYENKKALGLIMISSFAALVGFFMFIRQQTLISDREFLKSMIPHHSGAVLMCEKADLKDPEIQKLCETIIVSQQEEIEKMKLLLNK